MSHLKSVNDPVGVVSIGRKRPGFDQQWNEIIRRGALAALVAMGYEPIGAEAPVIDDATIIAAIDIIRARGCRALVVLQPSLGHGQLAMTVLQRWDGPVVLWATPERSDVEKVSSCSLVAQHLWAATSAPAQKRTHQISHWPVSQKSNGTRSRR